MSTLNKQPVGLQVVDPLLTNIARNYRSHGFIYDRITDDIPVSTLTGKYVVFDDQYWFQNEVDTLKIDRAPTKEIDYTFTTAGFVVEEHGLKVSYTDLELAQAASVLDLRRRKTEFLMQRMAIAREVRLAAILKKVSGSTPGALTSGAAPSVNWDQDTATIEADIKVAVLAVYDLTGIRPNTIIIPFKVAYAMAVQEDIRAQLKWDTSGRPIDFVSAGDRVLPSTIHGLNVIIPEGAQVDGANEGATASRSEIWGDDPRVLYVDRSGNPDMPSTFRRFLHTPTQIKTWRSDDPDVTYVRALERHDEVCVAPDTGYEIQDVLS